MTPRNEERAQGIRRLAGGVAHDLSNLLVVISGLAELAAGRLPTGEAPRNELERIQRAADRARELSRELLAIAGKQALRPAPTDLNRTLKDSEERLRGIVGEGIELQLALGEQVPAVFVDSNQLERILVNLARCARQRMPEGGRCVLATGSRAGPRTARPQGATAAAVRYALLCAHDTGDGLPSAGRARIFEPYYNPAGGPGLGLALAVIEGIVTQSGGRVRVRSDGARGASFELLLPVEGCQP